MKKVRKALDELSISYNDEMLEKLLLFYEEISSSSKNFNLTGLKGWDQIRDVLLIRSLRYAFLINSKFKKYNFLNNKHLKILDLGTGAGIPSIPLKIFFPNINLILADSSNKKCLFVRNIIEKLNLNNIKIINKRAEILGKSELRESFDLVLTRALAKLPTLAELSIPLIKIGGLVITAKGELQTKELQESEHVTKILGVSNIISEKIIMPKFLPEDDFIIWEKSTKSPEIYPRRDGVPKKNPLVKKT